MNDRNTAMMRDVFRWLSKYEQPPVGEDEKWWAGLVSEGADIHNRYPSPLTRHIIYGVIEGQEEQYRLDMIDAMEKRRAEGQQVAMDVSHGGAMQ